MLIGVPKEIKVHEYRVGMVPAGVEELIRHGHEVIVETRAGEGSGFADEVYEQVGAKIVSSAAEVFAKAEMIVKVKEPHPLKSRCCVRSRSCLRIFISPPIAF